MDRLVCISLFGMGFCLSLFFDSGLMVTGFSDIFQMDGDQGLPLGACMSLYKYDIKIAYHGIKSQKEPIVYDRQAIERQYTINNIIHEQ